MEWKIGDKVFAILGMSPGSSIVKILGPGTYQGEEVPPKDRPGWAGAMAEMDLPNHKILLDTGEIVFGCECWWGTESSMRKRLGEYETQMTTMSEALKEI